MSRVLLTNARLATMAPARVAYGLIESAALAIEDGRIAWCGPAQETPSRFQDFDRLDIDGRLVTPALIDCHTHVIFGGNRAREFELRLEGASYEQIARETGSELHGILNRGISMTAR